MHKSISAIYCAFIFAFSYSAPSYTQEPLFAGISFKDTDAVLVSRHSKQHSKSLYTWKADTPLIPASLTKLVTAWLALEKWGADHRFTTDFFIQRNTDRTTLWVKGYGDPFLTSEELDRLAQKLQSLTTKVDRIAIDNSSFDISAVPGRSQVADPYNAPLSAVSANFNTVFLQKKDGRLVSAEPQTPLTSTAIKVGNSLRQEQERVNLINADNAQRYFAELLAKKIALPSVEIAINSIVPSTAQKILSYTNSNTLSDNLRASLKYSNNFIANQIFLKLAEQLPASLDSGESSNSDLPRLDFKRAQAAAMAKIKQDFLWSDFSILEGAGLSRENRLSAKQIEDILLSLHSRKSLLKRIEVDNDNIEVYAKTGTLDGIRSYAGYIQVSENDIVNNYTFVFIFNRAVPFKYRDTMLARLLKDLQQ